MSTASTERFTARSQRGAVFAARKPPRSPLPDPPPEPPPTSPDPNRHPNLLNPTGTVAWPAAGGPPAPNWHSGVLVTEEPTEDHHRPPGGGPPTPGHCGRLSIHRDADSAEYEGPPKAMDRLSDFEEVLGKPPSPLRPYGLRQTAFLRTRPTVYLLQSLYLRVEMRSHAS